MGNTLGLGWGVVFACAFRKASRTFVFPFWTAGHSVRGTVLTDGTGEQLKRGGQMELVAGALAAILVLDAGKDNQPRGPKDGDGSGRGVFRDADASGRITDA